jgi:thiol-disulfide isomerase/thioredoxin
MRCPLVTKQNVRSIWLACCLLILIVWVPSTQAGTLDERYPGISRGLLKSAALESMDEDTILVAEGIRIKRSELLELLKDQEPKLRAQLEKNLLFVLEQEATLRVLRKEAQAAGIDSGSEGDDRMIQALFERKTEKVGISEEEIHAFYVANKAMIGEAPFERVADSIRQYLLQDKKQQAVADYIDGLGGSVRLRLNAEWAEQQSRLSTDNVVDKARRSGKPTLVEFGAKGCIPCDMMQPILDKLRQDYPQKLNVVFVHVGEDQILAARFGIRGIPVQVFFDARGDEVFRHVGFFAQEKVDQQLARMGVAK